MLRLSSPDLPLLPRTAAGGPILRLRWGAIAPALRINLYARYGTTPFTPVNLPMPSPDAAGLLIEVAFPGVVASVDSFLWGEIKLSMGAPGDPLPGYGWHDAERAFLYLAWLSPNLAITPVAALTASFTTPEPQGDRYVIDLGAWTDFDIQQVDIEGLRFSPAATPGSPLGGEFEVSGSLLTLTGSPSFRPAPLAPVMASGEWSGGVAMVMGAIATINLRESEVDYPDQVEYLGLTYQEVVSNMLPTPPCFFWAGQRLTLVAPAHLRGAFVQKSDRSTYVGSALGQNTYLGEVQ